MGMEYPAQPPVSPPPAKSNNRTIIIVVVVVLLLCCCCTVGGVGYWLWNNGDQLLRQLNTSQTPWGMLPLA
jgi:hypothetical protein